jgi:hypothetical protein
MAPGDTTVGSRPPEGALNHDSLESEARGLHERGIYGLSALLKKIRRAELAKHGRVEDFLSTLEYEFASLAGVSDPKPFDFEEYVKKNVMKIADGKVLTRPRAVLHLANRASNLGDLKCADNLLRHYEDLPASVKKAKKDELEVDYRMRTAQIGRKFKDAQEAINIAGKDPYRKNTALVLTGMIGLKDGRTDSKKFFEEILSVRGIVSWLYRAESWFGLACDELANGDNVQNAYKRLVAAQYVYVLLGLQGTPHTEFPLLEAKNLNDCTPADILVRNEKLRTLGKETCFHLRQEAIICCIQGDLIFDLIGGPRNPPDPPKNESGGES